MLRENPAFRLLWLSNLFFFAGVWTQTLVLAWLAFELTHSELLVAVFTAARLAPLLLGPLAGAFADRHNRILILQVTTAWSFLAVLVVAVLASAGMLTFPALVVGGLAIGLGQSPSQPARAAVVMELVGRESISSANALNSMAMNMTQVIGPALGGMMISALGAPAALWISAAGFLAAFALIIPLRGHGAVEEAPHLSAARMLVEGLRVLSRQRLAVAVLLVTLTANTMLWPVHQGFLPVFASDVLSLDATGLGLLLTCAGAGGLLGSLVIAGLGDFRFKGGTFVLGTALWGLLWAGFAASTSPALSFVLMTLIGVASAAFGVLQTTLLLLTTQPHQHGRVLGIQELAIGVMPLSSLAIGAAASAFGISATVVVAGLALVVILLVIGGTTRGLLAFDGREHPETVRTA